MTTESSVEPIKQDPAVIFTRAEVAMLWQLLNSPAVGTPLVNAATGASLYATVRTLAELHGLQTAPTKTG